MTTLAPAVEASVESVNAATTVAEAHRTLARSSSREQGVPQMAPETGASNVGEQRKVRRHDVPPHASRSQEPALNTVSAKA